MDQELQQTKRYFLAIVQLKEIQLTKIQQLKDPLTRVLTAERIFDLRVFEGNSCIV